MIKRSFSNWMYWFDVKLLITLILNYGVQFSTYAVPIIMGEIKRYFRDDGTIKVSRSLKELNLKINKARELLTNQTGQDPTVEQIAAYLDVDVQDVVEAIDSSYYPTSLSEPIYEKDGFFYFNEEDELKINIIRCGLKKLH